MYWQKIIFDPRSAVRNKMGNQSPQCSKNIHVAQHEPQMMCQYIHRDLHKPFLVIYRYIYFLSLSDIYITKIT